jgi:hypothetical protein
MKKAYTLPGFEPSLVPEAVSETTLSNQLGETEASFLTVKKRKAKPINP